MSDNPIIKLRQRKEALDNSLNSTFSKDMANFITQSNENLRKMREESRKYWISLAEKELTQGEADAKKGDTVSAITHSLAANNYLSLAELS